MKLAVLALLTIGCLLAAAAAPEEEYDYEDEAAAAPVSPSAPPARPSSARLGGLLSSRGRAPAARKPSPAVPSTTAKPAEQPAELEEQLEEELEDDREQQEEALTTTTEPSKKVRGGVRPFRSNQDLLEALKRRRAQAGPVAHREPSAAQVAQAAQIAAEASTAKSKTTSHGRGKSPAASSEAKSTSRGRFGGSRGSRPVQEEVEETQREEVQVKPKPYRRG